MKIRAIKDLVNARLAGEQLTYSTLQPYLDAVVDDINAKLHANFAVFSQVSLRDIDVEYAEFPDKYIRTVVAIGAAAKWYVDDEEGIEAATALMQQYNNNLFIMMRDYGPLVPVDKQADKKTGYLDDPNECTENGINPNLRYVEVVGPPGTRISGFEIQDRSDGKHLVVTTVDYKYGVEVRDCGLISAEIANIQLNSDGALIATMSNGVQYVVGNLANYMHNYLQVDMRGDGGSTAGYNTIKFEIEDL